MTTRFAVTVPAKKANLMPGARYILSKHKDRPSAERAARKAWRDSDVTGLTEIQIEELPLSSSTAPKGETINRVRSTIARAPRQMTTPQTMLEAKMSGMWTDEEREKQDRFMHESAVLDAACRSVIDEALAHRGDVTLFDLAWYTYQHLFEHGADARSEFLWGIILNNDHGEKDLADAKNWALGREAARLFYDLNYGRGSVAFKHIVSQLPGGFEDVTRHIAALDAAKGSSSTPPKDNPFKVVS